MALTETDFAEIIELSKGTLERGQQYNFDTPLDMSPSDVVQRVQQAHGQPFPRVTFMRLSHSWRFLVREPE